MSTLMANPAESWDVLARAATSSRSQAKASRTLQLLSFELDGAPYAIAVERVQEIVRMRVITPVPRVHDDVRGVISLRGVIIQVIDLCRRLNLRARKLTRSSRIIVVQGAGGMLAGLLVDSVTEVMRVAEDALLPGLAGETEAVESLCAWGDAFVSLIDLERVLEFGFGSGG